MIRIKLIYLVKEVLGTVAEVLQFVNYLDHVMLS